MTLFDRYIIRELLKPLAIGLGIVVAMLISNRLLKILPWLIQTRISLTEVLPVFLHLLPAFVTLGLPIAFFASTMMVYSRLSREGEYSALQAVGYSYRRILAPAMLCALTLGAAVWYASTEADPAGRRKFGEEFFDLVKSSAHRALSPIEPQYLPSGMIIRYASEGKDGSWNDVYFQLPQAEAQEPLRVWARRAKATFQAGSDQWTFQVWDGFGINALAVTEPTWVRFEEATVEFNPFGGTEKGWVLFKERTSQELRILLDVEDRPEERLQISTEIHKRWALAVGAAILPLVVVPISVGRGSRRLSKGESYGRNLLLLVAYYALFAAGRQGAIAGTVPPWLGMWAPNVLFAVFGAGFLLRKERA